MRKQFCFTEVRLDDCKVYLVRRNKANQIEEIMVVNTDAGDGWQSVAFGTAAPFDHKRVVRVADIEPSGYSMIHNPYEPRLTATQREAIDQS